VAVPSTPLTRRGIHTGSIGSVTADGNVIVPQGGDCVLDGTTVKGNVLVKSRASVVVKGGADVDGNLHCKNNDPAPVGGGNRVEGDKEGQCSSF
jgi:hypothetical protein